VSERYPGEEAERALLGSMLVSEAALGTCLEVLRAHHFYDARHRIIFQAIADTDAAGLTVDLVTVHDHARAVLEPLGGFRALADFTDHAHVGNVRHVCNVVYTEAVNRRIERIGTAIAEVAREHLPTEQRDQRIDRLLVTMYDTTAEGEEPPIGTALNDLLHDAESLAAGGSFGVPSGYNELDRILGGFLPGQLITVASRPGMGKTALGTNIIQNVVAANRGALLFSLEMAAKELAGRLLSRQADVPYAKLRVDAANLTADDWTTLQLAAGTIAAQPLYVDDRPPYTMASIRARARRAVRTKGIKLVVIDYLQLLAADHRGENRQVEVAEISRGLKMLARELEVPVLVMAQLSRATEKRENKRPQLSDLRDSGAIEQDSDIVIFPWREGYYEPTDGNRSELIVAKHRNGAIGTVYCRWRPQTVEFVAMDAPKRNVATVTDDDIPWR
jgi:replicative DNA helicase